LFARAIERAGGPAAPSDRQDLLADDRLRPLIGRNDDAREHELVGWFHPSLRRWFEPAADKDAGHRALLDAIEDLAPSDRHDYTNPLHRYAAAGEAVHAWAVGRADTVMQVLRRRTSAAPRQTLATWTEWNDRIQHDDRFSVADRFVARAQIATFTGISGRVEESRKLLAALIEDSPLPQDDREVLKARANLAQATGLLKRYAEARRMFEALLPEHRRVFGPTSVETLRVRLNLAFYTSVDADGVPTEPTMRKALALAKELLADQRALKMDDHPDTLINRANIANWTGELGDEAAAARECASIVDAWERVRRRDDVDVFRARLRHAKWTARSGNVGGARTMYQALLSDQERVLGSEHVDTKQTREQLAVIGAA
jgi:hypothetical protein